jgi:hypothetical protein
MRSGAVIGSRFDTNTWWAASRALSFLVVAGVGFLVALLGLVAGAFGVVVFFAIVVLQFGVLGYCINRC